MCSPLWSAQESKQPNTIDQSLMTEDAVSSTSHREIPLALLAIPPMAAGRTANYSAGRHCRGFARLIATPTRHSMSKLKTLRDLYIEQLQDLHSAETQLTKALPEMAEAATDPVLKAAFEEYLGQTKIHVERLEGICRSLDVSPKGQTCKAMKGLIAEGKESPATTPNRPCAMPA